jgi:hypothetical protein
VTFRVDWDQPTGQFVATCLSGCDPVNGPVYGVNVCNTVGCDLSGVDPHGWEYTVRMEVDEVHPICDRRIAYLERVVYTTTQVDNGYGIVGKCDLGLMYTPTSQTWTVTDYGLPQPPGTFSCYPGDCIGTPISIIYQ